eukprot:190920_1
MMQRIHRKGGSDSPRSFTSSSSSFHVAPLMVHDDESSSSSGYPMQPLVKVRPPSYATMHIQSPSLSSLSTSFTMRSRLSSIYSYFVERKTSIYGPSQSRKERAIFLIIISCMTFCGANNDFLGKLCYQSLPGTEIGMIGLRNRYWIAWLLTFGTFMVCSLAIVFGCHEWKRFKQQIKLFITNVSVPGTCDVWVNGGRYVGLVFLDAAVVTILKNGMQLLFSALFRKVLDKKTLTNSQTCGIVLVVIGLALVCVAIFLNESAASVDTVLMGIGIMISVGLLGSVRNHYEQILCRDMEYTPTFVIGMRSFVSIIWTLIVGMVLLSIPVLYETRSNMYSASVGTGWGEMYDGIKYVCSYPVFLVIFVLFCLAIYGKNITQMKVIQLSSALTRNLTMQLMPIGTWILSLIAYFVNPEYGEAWNDYSYIRLVGFLIVLYGSYLYMKLPKDVQETKRINHETEFGFEFEMDPHTLYSVSGRQFQEDIDLYGATVPWKDMLNTNIINPVRCILWFLCNLINTMHLYIFQQKKKKKKKK